MANKNEQPTVIVQVKRDHSLLWFLMFGWYYPLWLLIKWTIGVCLWPFKMAAKVGWLTMIEWPWKATVAACKWGAHGVQALIEQSKQRPQA